MKLTNVADEFTSFNVRLELSCIAGVAEVGSRILRHAVSHLIRTRGSGIDQADLAALDLMARAMRIVESERIETVDRPPGATGCPRISFRGI